MTTSRECNVANWILKKQNVEENQIYKVAKDIKSVGITKLEINGLVN